MRKLLYSILIFPLLLAFVGCNNLLDIKPVNSMIPVSIEDFESLLIGGYPKSEFFMKTEYSTDNVYANLNTMYGIDKSNEPFFVWASTHELPTATTDPYWGTLYKTIFYANSVLDDFEKRIPAEAEKELYEIVKGEAYALRAYAYFYLINLYAENYAPENMDKPGVPMPLTAEDVQMTSQNNVREPVKVVWEQINQDLDNATTLLSGKMAKSDYRFNYTSLQAFKARVYLFMGEWEKAISAATDVMNTKSLFDMNNLQSYIDEEGNRYAFGGDYGFTDTDYTKEILFWVGGKANGNMFYYDSYMGAPDPSLLELCSRNDTILDYRRYIFDSFLDLTDPNSAATGPTVYHFYGYQGTPCYYVGIELSEMYVTRAEAYMKKEKPEPGKAIADLNELLKSRIRTKDYVALKESDFKTNEDLLKRILEERRLETAFDAGLRWFDLRRLGKPEIRHAYKNGTEYVLKQGDLRYVLQIPISEQNASPNMTLNPRD